MWTECDDGVFYNYSTSSSLAHMEGHYLTLVEYDYDSLGIKPLKILVYSGDDDAVRHISLSLSHIVLQLDVIASIE